MSNKNISREETNPDYSWFWEEAYPKERADMVAEFNAGVPTQYWPVLSAEEVRKTWREFTGSGSVANKLSLEAMRVLVLRNVVRLYINTEIAGHTERRPLDVLEDENIEEAKLDEFVSWAIDTESGAWRISDYGLDKLVTIAVKLQAATTPGRIVMYIDAILNVTHQRSDLAALFIEGGINTLNLMAE